MQEAEQNRNIDPSSVNYEVDFKRPAEKKIKSNFNDNCDLRRDRDNRDLKK